MELWAHSLIGFLTYWGVGTSHWWCALEDVLGSQLLPGSPFAVQVPQAKQFSFSQAPLRDARLTPGPVTMDRNL